MRFLTILLILLVGLNGYSQNRQSLEEQRKQALREIEATDKFLKETLKSQTESTAKLNVLSAQVNQFNRLISSIRAEIDFFDNQIKITTQTESNLSREIEKLKAEYAALVIQAYKNRGEYNKLIYVISAKDFNEAYRRMKYFQQYSDFRKKQVAEIIVKQEELNGIIATLNEQKAEKAKLLDEQRKESRKLEVVKAEEDKVIKKLKSDERKLRAQLAEKKRNAERLSREITKAIEAEAKKRNTTVTNMYDRLTPEERLVASNFKGNKGRLPWPIERGVITANFGRIVHPVVKGFIMDNPGIDITTVANAEVRVIFEGEVTYVGGIPGENQFVLVRHGSFITVYQNLVDVKVKTGDKLKSKDIIGRVYTDKGADNSVLKFLIYEENTKLNPEQWIARR